MDRQATRAIDATDLVMRELRAQVEHQDRLATLGTAVALIVHEFRNLLTPLRAYAQMAIQEPHDQALVSKALTYAVDSAGHAAEIADLILAFAKPDIPDSAAVGGSPRSVAIVGPVLDQALQCLVREPEKDAIRLDVRIDPAATVALRPIALQHLLLNLILNARAAMLARGGVLRISASVMDAPPARLSQAVDRAECSTWNIRAPARTPKSNDRRWTVIVVEDSGRGMSAVQAREVFEPFVTMNTGAGGIGLGMAVCKRIVEDGGGVIEVDSAQGRGTRITITLPLAEQVPSPAKTCVQSS